MWATRLHWEAWFTASSIVGVPHHCKAFTVMVAATMLGIVVQPPRKPGAHMGGLLTGTAYVCEHAACYAVLCSAMVKMPRSAMSHGGQAVD